VGIDSNRCIVNLEGFGCSLAIIYQFPQPCYCESDQINRSPTTDVVSPLPVGRGFLDCVELKAVCHWARVFES
jgi:hypothetical protein